MKGFYRQLYYLKYLKYIDISIGKKIFSKIYSHIYSIFDGFKTFCILINPRTRQHVSCWSMHSVMRVLISQSVSQSANSHAHFPHEYVGIVRIRVRGFKRSLGRHEADVGVHPLAHSRTLTRGRIATQCEITSLECRALEALAKWERRKTPETLFCALFMTSRLL